MLDLLIEEQLGQPQKGARWSIKDKVQRATEGAVDTPANVPNDAWLALLAIYASTDQSRHSLVHRKASVDAQEALVGVDDNGDPLPALTADQQEGFARAVVRVSELAVAASGDSRVEADLYRQLKLTRPLHRVPLPQQQASITPRRIEFIAHLDDETGRDVLDVPRLRARFSMTPTDPADLTLRFKGRDGQFLQGWLEDAPDEVLSINPDDPPQWLHGA